MRACRSIILAVWPLAAFSQKPVISVVVNSASYATGEFSTISANTPFLGDGSLATIFGANLAATAAAASGIPLPRQLAGTAVSVFGIAAPLFYVSPNQINFQWPGLNDTVTGPSPAQGVVVSTAAGLSDPYTSVSGGGGASALGIFAQNATGCGAGAVLNVAADGSVSLNTPDNSARPGNFVSIYATGLENVYNAYDRPPDGIPTPLSPLATAHPGGEAIFDFSQNDTYNSYTWAGMAPGLIGVGQFNVQVPDAIREGCAVPLQLLADNNISRPVTLSVARGGGPCHDPATQGYGVIAWERDTVTTASNAVTESDTLTISLQASPGKNVPPPYPIRAILRPRPPSSPLGDYFGPACPIPGNRSLRAGTVTASGSGLGTIQAALAPFQGGTVLAHDQSGGYTLIPPIESGQAGGLTVYQANLAAGSIQAGSYTVNASGGTDVGAFQSTTRIGSPIHIEQQLAGISLTDGNPFTITWTGGDSNAWVTLRIAGNYADLSSYPQAGWRPPTPAR